MAMHAECEVAFSYVGPGRNKPFHKVLDDGEGMSAY